MSMPFPNDQLKDDVKCLVALLSGRILRDNLLATLSSPITQECFPTLAEAPYEELLMGNKLNAMFPPDVLSYDYNQGVLCGEAVDWNELARRTILKEPRLAAVVADKVNRMAQSSIDGYLRDIRNAFYAGDAPMVQSLIHALNQNSTLEWDSTLAFRFMDGHLHHAQWLADMDAERLSLLCTWYLPSAVSRLARTQSLLSASVAKWQQLTPEALGNLVDALMLNALNGADTARLDDMARNLSAPSQALRLAGILYLKGNLEASIQKYEELLAVMRKAMQKDTAYFQTLGGLFYILALIGSGTATNLERAKNYSLYGTKMRFWGEAYRRLHSFICDKLLQVPSLLPAPPPIAPQNDSPLGKIFCAFCDLWEEKNVNDALTCLNESLCAPKPMEYAFFTKEADAFFAFLNGTSDIPENSLASYAPMRPRWQRVMENIADYTSEQRQGEQSRLGWLCTYEEGRTPCPVTIRPVEQKCTRRGTWSKGRAFAIHGRPRTLPWPDYLTLQDQLICNILIDEQMRHPDENRGLGGFHCPSALEAAIGHPCLFWDENGSMKNFSCVRQRPVMTITKAGSQLFFSITPKVNDQLRILEKDSHNDLNVYAYTEQTAHLARELGDGIYVPHGITAKMIQFVRTMASCFTVFSDVSLEFTEIQAKKLNTIPHIRLLPDGDHMGVIFLVQPFETIEQLYTPGTGPLEYVSFQNGELTRFIRSHEQEIQDAEDAITACPTLANASSSGPMSFQLETLEECYNFTLELQKLQDKVKIHFPEKQAIRMSRRLTSADLRLKCRPSDGSLYRLEGGIKLDDGLLLTIKELLAAVANSKGRFIQLKNGQILALSDTFRKKLDDLSAVTMETPQDDIVFNGFATPFMGTLLDGMLEASQAREWTRKAKEIDKSMALTPDVPDKLANATLRPYQVTGFVWLCRHDAWGAGACLADDMGLGKTIQVIAFMLRVAAEGPALVVAPTSVCINWQKELERFAPSLDVLMLGGTKRAETFQLLKPGTVMISSYGLMNTETDAFRQISWRVVILDEAQAIKNHNTKRAHAVSGLNAKFRIITTGTPIENNLGELWSLFNFINPGLLGSKEHFRERFAVPVEEMNDKDALERLSRIVKPFILRRMKTEVLTELPPKTEIVLPVELQPEERTFYDTYHQQLIDEIDGLDWNDNQTCTHVIAAITKLRLAACNAKLIAPASTIPSAKADAFMELIYDLITANHKILVFSQFVKHLNILKDILDDLDVEYQYLTGEMNNKEREDAVKNFQDGKGDVFLISLKAGGQGLNLTQADYVIIMDPWWNPAVEGQAADRAYRFGQTKPVTIYRIVSQDTIEEKIIKLHQSKKDLADNILQGTNTATKLTKEELLALLHN